MFYKLKNEDIINLDEILAIGRTEDDEYCLVLKGALDFPCFIEKEDYDNIIKHLKIVNVSARACVYAEKRKLKLN